MSSRQQRPGEQMGPNDDDPPSPDILSTFEDIEDEMIDHEHLSGFRIFPSLTLIPAFRNSANEHENPHRPFETDSNWLRERENHEVSSDIRQSHLMGRSTVLETDQTIARSTLTNAMLSDTSLPDTRNKETQTDSENLSGNQILGNISNSERHPTESASREHLSLCHSPVHMANATEQTTDSLNFQCQAEKKSSGQSAGSSLSLTSEKEDYSTILEEIDTDPDKPGDEASSVSNSRVDSIANSAQSPSSYFEQGQQSLKQTHTPQLSEVNDSSSARGTSDLPQQSRGNDFESKNPIILPTHPTKDVLTMDRSLPSLTTSTVMVKITFENNKEVPHMTKIPSKNQISNYHPQNWPATDAANSLIPSSQTSTETTDVASDHQIDMLNYNTRKRPATHAPIVDSLITVEEDPDCGDDSQAHPPKKGRTTIDRSANSPHSNNKM